MSSIESLSDTKEKTATSIHREELAGSNCCRQTPWRLGPEVYQSSDLFNYLLLAASTGLFISALLAYVFFASALLLPFAFVLFGITFFYQNADLAKLFNSHIEAKRWPWQKRLYITYGHIVQVKLTGTLGPVEAKPGNARFADTTIVCFQQDGRVRQISFGAMMLGRKRFNCLADSIIARMKEAGPSPQEGISHPFGVETLLPE